MLSPEEPQAWLLRAQAQDEVFILWCFSTSETFSDLFFPPGTVLKVMTGFQLYRDFSQAQTEILSTSEQAGRHGPAHSMGTPASLDGAGLLFWNPSAL